MVLSIGTGDEQPFTLIALPTDVEGNNVYDNAIRHCEEGWNPDVTMNTLQTGCKNKQQRMKFYKTIMKTVMVAMAAMTVLSCQEKSDQGGNGSQLNEDLELIVDVEDVTYTSAKIKVTHNGSKSDTWYGFLTDVVGGDEEELISQAVEAYMNGESDEGLRRSKSYVNVFKELTPGTSYKYIAFGLSADGQVYGSIASVEFDTVGSSSEDPGNQGGTGEVTGMRVNKAWTVNYVGEGVINGEDYDHVITVNSTDRNLYAITVVFASLWNTDDLYDMAVIFAEDLVAWVEDYNDYYGTSYTVADALYSGTASDAFDLDPGYYIAVALGITAEGKVSGLYATSEVFEVKEQEPTPEYKEWLGDWTIVGENDVEFTVTLRRHVTNKSFWMYGYEGFEDIPVDVEYSKDRNDLTFYAQLVQEDYYLEKQDVYADMYFLGGDTDDNYYTLENGNYGIAIAGVLEGGSRALVRYGVNQPGYPKFMSMFYAAEVDGKFSCFTETKDLPTFRGIAEFNPAVSVSSFSKRPAVRGSADSFMPSETLKDRLR